MNRYVITYACLFHLVWNIIGYHVIPLENLMLNIAYLLVYVTRRITQNSGVCILLYPQQIVRKKNFNLHNLTVGRDNASFIWSIQSLWNLLSQDVADRHCWTAKDARQTTWRENHFFLKKHYSTEFVFAPLFVEHCHKLLLAKAQLSKIRWLDQIINFNLMVTFKELHSFEQPILLKSEPCSFGRRQWGWVVKIIINPSLMRNLP